MLLEKKFGALSKVGKVTRIIDVLMFIISVLLLLIIIIIVAVKPVQYFHQGYVEAPSLTGRDTVRLDIEAVGAHNNKNIGDHHPDSEYIEYNFK